MKHKYLLIVLCIMSYAAPAQNYTGVWEGTFSTDLIRRLGRRTFFMRMEVEQKGSSIVAYFYNAPLDFPKVPDVIYRVSGKISRKDPWLFLLTRDGIVESNIDREVSDIFNNLEVHVFKNDTLSILYGKWFGSGVGTPRSDGAAGVFRLLKKDSVISGVAEESRSIGKKKKNNPVKVTSIDSSLKKDPVLSRQKNYFERTDSITNRFTITNTENVTLELYDNGIIDHDSVSVYINDSLTLNRIGLKAKPFIYPLKLEKGKTYKITLFAENLGEIPPNTAYLVIRGNNKSWRDLFLATDLDRNASVLLKIE